MKKFLHALSVGVLVAFVSGCTVTKTTRVPQKEPTVAAPQPPTVSVTSPVVAAPAVAAQPATANGISLWNFESKSTHGWSGKEKWSAALTVNDDARFVKDGRYSLKINAKGSNGWNQDIAVNEGPFPAEFSKLKAVTMDVYAPKETIEGLPYAQLFLVVSSSANAWYQVEQDLKEGWNSLTFNIEADNVGNDISQVYLILNSSTEFNGPIYIDNVAGKY